MPVLKSSSALPSLAIAAFAALTVAAQLVLLGTEPVLAPDSASYLDWAAHRTLGYPLFLSLAGSTSDAVVLQIILAGACLLFLGSSARAFTGSTFAALAAMALIAANPELAKYQASILTESIFVSLTMLILAMLLRLLAKPAVRVPDVAALSGAMGLAVAIRPPGLAFLPLLAILAVLLWPRVRARPLALAGAAILPALGIVASERLAASALHSTPPVSMFERTVFAKAGMLDAGPAPYPAGDPRRAVWEDLDAQMSAARRLVAGAPGAAARHYIAVNYEVYAQYHIDRSAAQAAAGALGQRPGAILREVGLARIAAAPWAYLSLSAQHFAALWRLYGASHPAAAPGIGRYLDAHRPLPLAGAGGVLDQPIAPRAAALVIQPAVLALGALSGLAIAWLLIAWLRGAASAPVMAAGLCALMVNGNFLLVALTNIGIPRYMLAMWPALMLMAVLLAVSVWRAWSARKWV
ncbi:MAG: hypothetical protein NW223_01215 [Hyphomicrobiaceae bacterium]|nr:hypothetical protein [Hyphomicrobiaceae bacterium]